MTAGGRWRGLSPERQPGPPLDPSPKGLWAFGWPELFAIVCGVAIAVILAWFALVAHAHRIA